MTSRIEASGSPREVPEASTHKWEAATSGLNAPNDLRLGESV